MTATGFAMLALVFLSAIIVGNMRGLSRDFEERFSVFVGCGVFLGLALMFAGIAGWLWEVMP